jgi:hypothetical protein
MAPKSSRGRGAVVKLRRIHAFRNGHEMLPDDQTFSTERWELGVWNAMRGPACVLCPMFNDAHLIDRSG